MSIFFIFLQDCLLLVANFNQKYEISDDILKADYLVNRLTLRLIKQQNQRCYYLNSLAVELHLSCIYILSNELLVQKFSEFLMILVCSSDNVSISDLSDYKKLSNVFINRNKNISSGFRANVKLTHFTINNQYPSKLLKTFELKVHLIR